MVESRKDGTYTSYDSTCDVNISHVSNEWWSELSEGVECGQKGAVSIQLFKVFDFGCKAKSNT